jgi:hypothetical protein
MIAEEDFGWRRFVGQIKRIGDNEIGGISAGG